MRHLIILVALLAVAGLDLIFVSFSPTAQSALTFAVLAFLIMLLLGVTAGSQAKSAVDFTGFMGPWVGRGVAGFLTRLGLGLLIPLALLLVFFLVPSLNLPVETVDLIRNLSVFWMVTTLALAGAALAFFWPRNGIFEAVLVGGLIITASSLISWLKTDAGREQMQLALFGQMLWPSVCLIGAWVGLGLREITECHLYKVDGLEVEADAPDLSPEVSVDDPGTQPHQIHLADSPAPAEVAASPTGPDERSG